MSELRFWVNPYSTLLLRHVENGVVEFFPSHARRVENAIERRVLNAVSEAPVTDGVRLDILGVAKARTGDERYVGLSTNGAVCCEDRLVEVFTGATTSPLADDGKIGVGR